MRLSWKNESSVEEMGAPLTHKKSFYETIYIIKFGKFKKKIKVKYIVRVGITWKQWQNIW